jgi:hypothetical protein
MVITAQAGSAGSPARAWIIGGSLFLLAVVLEAGMLIRSDGGLVRSVVLAAAFLVFAYGIRGGGSVTARGPVGTIALTALAISLPAVVLLTPLLLASNVPFGTQAVVTQIVLLVQFMLALTATVRIGRLAVVPRPWNWAPAIVMVALALSVVAQAVATILVTQNVQAVFLVLVGVDEVLRVGALVGLGVLAIVLGDRAGRPNAA